MADSIDPPGHDGNHIFVPVSVAVLVRVALDLTVMLWSEPSCLQVLQVALNVSVAALAISAPPSVPAVSDGGSVIVYRCHAGRAGRPRRLGPSVAEEPAVALRRMRLAGRVDLPTGCHAAVYFRIENNCAAVDGHGLVWKPPGRGFLRLCRASSNLKGRESLRFRYGTQCGWGGRVRNSVSVFIPDVPHHPKSGVGHNRAGTPCANPSTPHANRAPAPATPEETQVE